MKPYLVSLLFVASALGQQPRYPFLDPNLPVCDYSPGGRLTVTWPKSPAQLPPMMDYNIRHGRTYMYFKDEPLYRLGSARVTPRSACRTSRPTRRACPGDGSVKVSVDVTNTGARDGDEVVQLYAKHLGSKVERPRQQFVGFQRVTLKAGETRTVEISMAASRLAYWDAKTKALTVEPEPISILVGDSTANLRLSANVRVE